MQTEEGNHFYSLITMGWRFGYEFKHSQLMVWAANTNTCNIWWHFG
jgi:hypothetical protein